MTFTKEQMAILAKHEENFTRAMNAQWARNPGRAGLTEIYDTLTAATGDNRHRNFNCQSCILRLLRDTGKLYFADKAEMEAELAARAKAGAEAKAVELSDQEAKPVKKATVKTTKKSTKAKAKK